MARTPRKDAMAAGGGFGAVPQLNAAMRMTDVGVPGLRAFSGWVREEFLPELVGRQGARIYREMGDNSPIIAAVLFAIMAVMRKVEWRTKPPEDMQGDNASKAAEDVAEFADTLRHDMSHTWEDFVVEALSMLRFGYCLPGDQPVMRANGQMVAASAVRVGDMLMTEEGRGRPVLRIFTRQHDGVLSRIRLRGYPFPIRVTPNHQVATSGEWKAAGELLAGEMMIRPRAQMSPGGDYASGWIVGLYLAEGSRAKPRTRIVFSLHEKEVDEVADILDAWIAANGLSKVHHLSRLTAGRAKSIAGSHAGRVSFSHPRLAGLIEEWVQGDNAHAKSLTRLPCEEEFARGILDGWQYGDGSDSVDKRNGSAMRQATTASRDLAHQMQIIAGSLGLPAPMAFQIGGGIGISGKAKPAMHTISLLPERSMVWKRTETAEARVRELRASGMAMQAIATECSLSYLTVWRWLHTTGPKTQGLQCRVFQRSIGHEVVDTAEEPFSGTVYDFEVDEDHTYCAGPVVVHNSPHEIVYKVRAGRRKFGDKVASSRFDDGAMGWARLPLRGQETVLKWFFDENGQWTGLTQQPWTGTLIDIPAEKLILFRPQQHKNNPEGYSILRSAYRSYYFIKRLEEGEAILFERLSGIPVVKLPNQLFEAARGTGPLAGQASAILAEWKKIVRNVRIDEQMGLVIPSDPFPNATGGLSNTPQYEFKLETPQGGRANLDANTPIARHKQDILTATLTDFILMGHTTRGAQNLGETKMDMFMTAVEGWMNAMAGVMNHDAIPRVMALNGVDEALWPTYAPDLAQRVDLDGLSNFILRLAQSGMPLFPDPDLQTYLRDVAGMPVESEEGAEERARNASPQPPGDEPEDVKEARARLTELVKAMQAAKDETPLRRGARIAKGSRP